MNLWLALRSVFNHGSFSNAMLKDLVTKISVSQHLFARICSWLGLKHMIYTFAFEHSIILQEKDVYCKFH
jgi:hypothetical protein